jgi:myo-inositol-1(or 4)-monophosphatase
MNDDQWLAVFRKIGRQLREGIAEVLSRKDGTVALGRGAGGDRTFPVDRWAEDIVITELGRVHADGETFTLISEEAGVKSFGDGDKIVLVDPIDGSNNAKNGVPFFATAMAFVDGERLSGLRIGYVINVASGDEYWALKGSGAFKNGARIVTPDNDAITIVAYEASDPANDIPRILPLLHATKRTRCFGSTALDLAYLASGAVSVFATATSSRAFDYAAGMLIVREAGGIMTDLSGNTLDDVVVGIGRTVPLLAAKNAATHRSALMLLKE